MPTDAAFQQCINPDCAATYAIGEVQVACTKCGSLLDIRYDWSRLPVPRSLGFFEASLGHQGHRRRRAARFLRRLAIPRAAAVLIAAKTTSSPSAKAGPFFSRRICSPDSSACDRAICLLQYEGLNPSGSFKDNGMTAAFTHAKMVGAKKRRVRIDRQHQREPGDVRVACRNAGHRLHRLRQDLGRQAVAGAGLRCADAADPGRFRRVPASHSADRRRSCRRWAST